MGTIALYLGRFVPMIAALAVAGSLAGRRRSRPPRPARSAPTAPTFSVLLVAVILIVAGLTIFPALALGPVSRRSWR